MPERTGRLALISSKSGAETLAGKCDSVNIDRKTSGITFIIPAYNCAGTIQQAVFSITNGNLKEGDDIVVVNDGSTDETRDMIARIEEQHGFIRVINHQVNNGGAAARNTAAENSSNETIFCLDSDNLLIPGSVRKLKEYMVSSGADVAAFEALHYFQDNPQEITHRWVFKRGIHTLSDCLAGAQSPIASGNYMYTKASWKRAGGYPEFAGALDAWGFGLRQIASGAKMTVLPEYYYLHRYGHESYWIRSSGERDRIAFRVLEPFLHMIEDEDAEYIRNNRDSWFSNLSKHAIRIKNEGKGVNGRVISPSFVKRIFNKLTKNI